MMKCAYLGLIFLLFGSIIVLAGNVSATELSFVLYWELDNVSYCIGDQGILKLWIENTGSIPFKVTWAGAHFQWEEEGYYFQLDLSDNPIKVAPGAHVFLGELEFEIFDNAAIGENTFYIEIDYEYYDDRYKKETWRADIRKIYVNEPITAEWWYEPDKESFRKGETLNIKMNITNNCNRCLRITEIGVRGDWLPEGAYSWTGYSIVVEPGQFSFIDDIGLKIPKTAEAKWYKIEAIIGYQIGEENDWSNTVYFDMPAWYAIEVVESKSIIGSFEKAIQIISGIGAVIGIIAGVIKTILNRKSKAQTPPPPPD